MKSLVHFSMCINKEQLQNRICMQSQDLHAIFGIKERRKHTGSSRSCTDNVYTLLQAYFHSTSCSFRYRSISKIAVFGIYKQHFIIGKSPEGPHRYTCFLSQEGEFELIFTLQAAVSKSCADFLKFQYMYLAMKLGHRQKFQNLHNTQAIEIEQIMSVPP